MALPITDAADAARQQVNVETNIVLAIEGYPRIFGVADIKKLIRIGDPDLFIGNDWTIGGYRLVANQAAYISWTNGTTTKIQQQLQPDKGLGSSVSQMTVSLVDFNGEISKLISPGFELSDVLGRNAKVSIGFVETSYPDDYNTIFVGLISEVSSGSGYVSLVLNNAEEKKRKPFGQLKSSILASSITNSQTTIPVANIAIFSVPTLGPDGGYDDDIEFLARVDDEIIRYTGVSGNSITGCIRGYFGTSAAAHDSDADIRPYYRMLGNGLDLSLKIMLSGWNGSFVQDVPIRNFNFLDSINHLDNAIFFEGINVAQEYGIIPGDWMRITGAANAANNSASVWRQIADIDVSDGGSYIVISGMTLVDETDSAAVCEFRSQFDVFGFGLGMNPKEVDVAQHVKVRDRYLPVFNFDFIKTNITEAKSFIEQQIYLPMACFSVPRSGKASVNIHTGPLVEDRLITFNATNVINASSLILKRSLSKNFANTIVFNYELDAITEKYLKTITYDSPEAKEQVPVGDRLLTINADGLRTSTSALQRSQLSANRLIKRYKLGAEFIQGMKVQFGDGYFLEIGDIVAVDYASLQITDTNTGDRSGKIKLMEIQNKIIDNKTGEVSLDLVNTIFDLTDRAGTISPASKTASGSTTEKLVLQKSWSTKPWQKESTKWKGYEGQTVIVHSPDWTYNETTQINSFSDDGSVMLLSIPLPSAPPSGYIVQAPNYPSDSDPNVEYFWKARHCSFSPQLTVVTGSSQTVFTVSAPDASRILVGAILRIHTYDYSDDSPEVVVTDKTGVTITVDRSIGFIPNSSHYIDLVGFLDGGFAYRIL